MPAGVSDENVFDIKQGVAISIFVREHPKSGPARVYHDEVWGGRDDKYRRLESSSVVTTAWREVFPKSPSYLFVPVAEETLVEYEQGWPVTRIFPLNSLGFQSHRDAFVIDFDYEALLDRMRDFAGSEPDASISERYGVAPTKTWDMASARSAARSDPGWEGSLTECAYRPFHRRWVAYHDAVVERRLAAVLWHLVGGDNVALCTMRQTKGEWRHALVANAPIPALFAEIRDGTYAFPLYLYPSAREKAGGLFPDELPRPNLSSSFIAAVSSATQLNFVTGPADLMTTFGPRDVLHYVLAVLNSPFYTQTFDEHLRRDYPRVPTPTSGPQFAGLARLGAEVATTYLDGADPTAGRAAFPVGGSDVVERGYPLHQVNDQRVLINRDQYFDGVEQESWRAVVGGYQVLSKWLSDRRGRKLSHAEITWYQRTVAGIRRLQDLRVAIDELLVGESAIRPD